MIRSPVSSDEVLAALVEWKLAWESHSCKHAIRRTLNDGTLQKFLMDEGYLWEPEIRKKPISSALGCIPSSMLGPGKLAVKIALPR